VSLIRGRERGSDADYRTQHRTSISFKADLAKCLLSSIVGSSSQHRTSISFKADLAKCLLSSIVGSRTQHRTSISF
jgi:hypothetical protein